MRGKGASAVEGSCLVSGQGLWASEYVCTHLCMCTGKGAGRQVCAVCATGGVVVLLMKQAGCR